MKAKHAPPGRSGFLRITFCDPAAMAEFPHNARDIGKRNAEDEAVLGRLVAPLMLATPQAAMPRLEPAPQ